MGPGMTACIDPPIFTDVGDALSSAKDSIDRLSEDTAEDSYHFDAMQIAENAVDHADSELQDCLALRRMGRRATQSVIDAVQAVRDARESLTEATADYERGVS